MTKRLFRTALASGRCTDVQPDASRSQWGRILIPYHPSCGLRFHASPRLIQELGQEFCDIRRRGVCASPRRAKFAPVNTVPIPLLRFGIAATGFWSRIFSLTRDHLFQLESAKPLG